MATLGFRRERGRRKSEPVVELQVSADDDATEIEPPVIPWMLSALGGGLVAAAAGWLLISLLLVVGWTATPDIGLSSVLAASTRLWLLGHGADVSVGSLQVGIVPLGLSVLLGVIVSGVAGFAATMARRVAPEQLSSSERRAIALRVSGLFAGVYVAVVLIASVVVVDAQTSARALVGAVILGGGSALWGATRATEWHPSQDLPEWLRPVPRAFAASCLVMMLTGAAVLATAMIRERERIATIHDSLQPGAVGGILLAVVQLLYLLNLVIWSASWATGAGFSLGVGTLVSPAATELGVLPAIPVLGAVPEPGPGAWPHFLWLIGPVAAGVVAAAVVVRSRPRARWDETALAGGLAGVLAGVVVVVAGVLSAGDLGSVRLVGLGPRIAVLAVMAPTLLGFAGVLTGAILGLVRRPAVREDVHNGDVAHADLDVTQPVLVADSVETSDSDPTAVVSGPVLDAADTDSPDRVSE